MEETTRVEAQNDVPSPALKLRAIAAKVAFAASLWGFVLGGLAIILKNWPLS